MVADKVSGGAFYFIVSICRRHIEVRINMISLRTLTYFQSPLTIIVINDRDFHITLKSFI